MSTPLVSILLPVRNGEPYLTEAMRSALAQTLGDWELVVSENCSRDRSWDIIRSFADPRIKVFQQEQSLTMAQNWDFTLQRATGSYWLLLGADDVLEPNHLESRVALHSRHPSLGLSSGAYTEIDAAGRVVAARNQAPGAIESAAQIVRRLLGGSPLNIMTMFCARAATQRAGAGFDAQFPSIPDWHLWLRLLLDAEGLLWSDQPTVRYRVHEASLSAQNRSADWAFESTRLKVDLLEKFPGKFRALGMDPDRELREATRNLWLNAQQLFRARQLGRGQAVWKLFRRYHGPADFARYAGAFLRQRLRGPS